MKIYISPSILSADFANLANECNGLIADGADFIHCDVMDGVFVPNFTFGMPVVQAIDKVCDAVLDVHLMIVKPERYIEQFLQAGADILTFHLEATENIDKCIEIVKSHNKKVGISINPNTPVELLLPYLDKIDLALVMSVEAGFGGQSFRPSVLDKVRKIRSHNSNILIEMDGGISEKNVQECIDSGANVIVAGSAIFNSADKRKTIELLRGNKN